jgi:hypothetical protein
MGEGHKQVNILFVPLDPGSKSLPHDLYVRSRCLKLQADVDEPDKIEKMPEVGLGQAVLEQDKCNERGPEGAGLSRQLYWHPIRTSATVVSAPGHVLVASKQSSIQSCVRSFNAQGVMKRPLHFKWEYLNPSLDPPSCGCVCTRNTFRGDKRKKHSYDFGSEQPAYAPRMYNPLHGGSCKRMFSPF